MKKELKMFGVACLAMAGSVLMADDAPVQLNAMPVAQAPVSVADAFGFLPENVAEINGVPVKKQVVIDQLLKEFPDGKLPEFVNETMLKQLAPQLVRAYVYGELLNSALAKSDIKPSEAAAKAFLQKELLALSKDERDMLNQQLTTQNKTIDQYISELSANADFQKFVAQRQYAESTYLKDVNVTEADAKKFYDENKNDFVEPGDKEDQIRASHILVKVEPNADEKAQKDAIEKINKMKEQLAAKPESFSDLAAENSDCPSGANGGSLGVFGKGQMVPEFEKAAFALKPGEISDVVKTEFGYHLIRRDQPMAERVIPFDEVKKNLIAFLKRQKEEELQMQFIKKLEEENKVKFFVAEAGN